MATVLSSQESTGDESNDSEALGAALPGRYDPDAITVLMTGAPDFNELCVDATPLSECLTPRVRRYLALDGFQPQVEAYEEPACSLSPARWREIALQGSRHDTFAQPDVLLDEVNQEFLYFQDGQERSVFLEHTLSMVSHLTNPDDQALNHGDDSQNVSTTSFLSTLSTEISFISGGDSDREDVTSRLDLHFTGIIHDIKSIPSARYIESIEPQTMTVNLLVGIISVDLQTVQLRRSAEHMALVELLVGDETATAFKLTFWLPSCHNDTTRSADPTTERSRSGAPESSEDTILSLRKCDVVFFTNIALNVFKGVSYGQPLRRTRFAPASSTTVTRIPSATNASALPTSLRNKVFHVRTWVTDYVGRPAVKRSVSGAGHEVHRSKRLRRLSDTCDALPEDTQT